MVSPKIQIPADTQTSLGNVLDPSIHQLLENAIGKDQSGSHIVPLP